MGIYNPQSADAWVPDQFEGFKGFPANEAGVLAIASPASGPQLLNIQPLATTAAVMGVTVPSDGISGGGGGSGSGGGGGGEVMDPAALSVNGSAGTGGQGGMIGPAVLPSLQPMPSATTASMPTMTGTANATLGTNGNVGTTPAGITAQWLTQRLPSIVNPAPAVIPQDCQSGFAGWVSENPLLAAAGLAALAFMVWGKK